MPYQNMLRRIAPFASTDVHVVLHPGEETKELQRTPKKMRSLSPSLLHEIKTRKTWVINPNLPFSHSNNKTSSRPNSDGLPITIAPQPSSANSFQPSTSVRVNRFLTLPHVRASHFNVAVQFVVSLVSVPQDPSL